jgi:hypothetical protein
MRDAVDEVRGAVDGIDEPAMLAIATGNRACLLHHQAIGRARLAQFLLQDALGALVGLGHEVGRAFQRHLEIFDLAKVALHRSRGLARGIDHDRQGW